MIEWNFVTGDLFFFGEHEVFGLLSARTAAETAAFARGNEIAELLQVFYCIAVFHGICHFLREI